MCGYTSFVSVAACRNRFDLRIYLHIDMLNFLGDVLDL